VSDDTTQYYCATCNAPAQRPLQCRDCLSLICRECGTPLESADELGFG